MVNSVLGNDAAMDIAFTDVQQKDWFYDDIRKGVAAAFISGYSASEFGPANKITRQEAAVMLSRIVPAYGKNVTLKVFGDYESIDFWAEEDVYKRQQEYFSEGSSLSLKILNPSVRWRLFML